MILILLVIHTMYVA